jgi:hypothetical protein
MESQYFGPFHINTKGFGGESSQNGQVKVNYSKIKRLVNEFITPQWMSHF